MQLAVDLVVRNKTTGKALRLHLPAEWDGSDLSLDFRRRTVTDSSGADRSSLLDISENALWAVDPMVAGSNEIEIESVRAATVAGPNLPKAANVDGSTGTQEWSEPGNVKIEDTLGAQVSGTSDGKSTQSKYLVATDFGLSIPTGATIKGIVGKLRGNRTSQPGGAVTFARVRLLKAGVILAPDRATAGLNVTASEREFGGTGDLWENAWAAGDFDSKFGIAIAVNLVASTGFTEAAAIDWVKTAVYYQDPTIIATLRWEKGYF